MALAAGAIGGLLRKLHELSMELQILPRRVGSGIMSLIEDLESIQSALLRMSEADLLDQQVKLWTEDAANLSYHIDGLIGKFTSTSGQQSGSAAIPTGDIIASVKLKLTTAKARRKFVADIMNVHRLVQEFVGRRERYRIDSTFFPFRPPRPSDVGEPPRDGDIETEMATGAELAALLLGHLYKLPSRVKDDTKFLKAELEMVTVVLRKIEEVPVGELDEVTEAWADDLRDVSRNVKRAVEEFQSHIGSDPQSKGKGYKLTTMKARRQFAGKIRNLKRCLLEVADRRQRYDLRELRVPRRTDDDDGVAVGTGIPDQPRQYRESLVAIDGHRGALVQLLTDEGSTSTEQLKLASIVGVAGVGKTTLAKAVYDILAPQFDCAAWVSLPTLPDVKGALHDLLRQIDAHKVQDTAPPETLDAAIQVVDAALLDVRDLIDKICSTLQDKRYFVVIDDLWDLAAWNTMKHALIGKSNGSAVLTTSRKFDIAEYVGSVYILHPLSQTDSRKLFYKMLFHSEDKCSPGLAARAEKFIEKCGGIPAAITSTAALLASKPWTEKEWYEVHGSADYEHEGGPNVTKRILDVSYNDLPFHLKPCLLYLSMFPRGNEISGEHLVWLWIAEGFIQEIQGETLQEVGESYLNELIKRKFIKSVDVDAEGKALSCSVYDKVYDLIISKSTEQNFATVVDSRHGRCLPDMVHRLSIQGNSSEQTPLQGPLSDVRTLVVYSNAKVMPFLSKFQELRALDLGGCDWLQNDHLVGIENSFLLKYLVIGGKCITGLPKEIARLKLLQTLDLKASGLKELPESIVLVRNLERLFVNSHIKIPDWIGRMEALQELADINISKPELLKELCKLTKLRVLRIEIWTWDESYNEELLDFLRLLVKDRLQNIRNLSIRTCCSLHFMGKLDAKWAPPGLQKLQIRDSTFFNLPGWIGSLQNLSSLTVEVNKLSQEMVDILGKLQSLCSLSLTSNHAPEGKFGIVPGGFKNLTSLRFAANAMGKIFAAEPKSMQTLKRLQLWFKALQTENINQGFNFGMEDLCSLENICIEIVCFNASRRVVENAEAAIREAISRGRSRRPNLEMRRIWEGEIIESEDEVAVSNTKQEDQKEAKNKKRRKVKVISKKFPQKEKGVPRKYKIVSVHLRSHILTLQAL
ncbi:unnamed protein product [Urochloa humidicola]